MTQKRYNEIPKRQKCVNREHPYIGGAIDVYDDNLKKNQEVINSNVNGDVAQLKSDVADRYTKSEVNNIISRTPETDVVVLDVPEGGTAADALNAVPVADRPNKLFRVRNDANTKYDEYGWTGEVWALLASKDYGIDLDYASVYEKPTDVLSSGALFNELKDLKKLWKGQEVKGWLESAIVGIRVTDGFSIIVIPLNGNEKIDLRTNSSNVTWLNFAKTFNYPNYEKVDWIDDNRVQITKDTNYSVELDDGEHDGAKYLLLTHESNVDRKFQYVFINGKNIYGDDILPEEVDHAMLSKACPPKSIYHGRFLAKDSNFYPFMNTGATYEYAVVPLIGVSQIEIIGSSITGRYALLNNFNYPYYEYADGYTEAITLPINGTPVTISVGTAKYLAYNTQLNGEDRTPLSIKLDGKEILGYNIRNDIDSRVTNEKFDKIVGPGLTKIVDIIPYRTTYLGETVGNSISTFLKEGERVDYDLYFGGNVEYSIFQVTTNYASGFLAPDNIRVIETVRSVADGIRRHYTGTYTATQDCFFKVRGFIPNEEHTIGSNAIISENITSSVKQDVESNGLLKWFNISTPQTLLNAVGDNLNGSFGMGSVLTVRNGLYYMYLQATYKSNLVANDYYGFTFAWSNDGFDWHREYPSGTTPVDPNNPNLNCMFKIGSQYRYNVYKTSGAASGKVRYCIEVLEQKDRQRYFVGFDVKMVADNVNPFRVIGNKCVTYIVVEVDDSVIISDIETQVDAIIDDILNGGEGSKNLDVRLRNYFNDVSVYSTSAERHYYRMMMFKSADGIHWGDYDTDGIEVSELSYDSQYSIIPRGNVMKVYERGWDYTKPEAQRRNVAVMTIDLDGNIISSSTSLFGDGLYNSAASEIDDRRELLLPTFFYTDSDKAEFRSYIVNGGDIVISSDINDIMKGIDRINDTDEEIEHKEKQWGMVLPGLILKDGDIYFTYMLSSSSHDKTYVGSPAFNGINIVQLSWVRKGSANKGLRRPNEIAG